MPRRQHQKADHLEKLIDYNEGYREKIFFGLLELTNWHGSHA